MGEEDEEGRRSRSKNGQQDRDPTSRAKRCNLQTPSSERSTRLTNLLFEERREGGKGRGEEKGEREKR